MMLAFQDRQSEHWALLSNSARQNPNLAVFVHGFRGNYLDTWGVLPDLLRSFADTDPRFRDWDFLFLGYDTKNIETYLDIAVLISTQMRLATQGDRPFAHAYRRFALFGHSLGTLGIRQLLCATCLYPASVFQAISSVVLFGSPINGSPWAKIALFYKVKGALEPESPQLRMLRKWMSTCYAATPWPEVKLVLGHDDKVVGSTASFFIDWPNDEANPQYSNFDHGELVKPKSWDQSLVVDIVGNNLR